MRRLKLYFALLGLTLAVAGVALDNRPLVWAAIAVLCVALAIRLWLRRQDRAQAAGGA